MTEGYSLDGYIEVPDRILKFKEKFPEGSLQGEYVIRELEGQTWVIYHARAYRTPDDERPGIGMAWEPFPGKTSYTKDSELMNAETSAWGRAIVALGFLAKDEKVASANEVRARQGNGSDPAKPGLTEKQLNFIERLVKGAGATPEDAGKVRHYCAEKLTGGRGGTGSQVIERLKDKDKAGGLAAKMVEVAEEWLATQSDVPADTEGLPAATPEDEQIPF